VARLADHDLGDVAIGKGGGGGGGGGGVTLTCLSCANATLESAFAATGVLYPSSSRCSSVGRGADRLGICVNILFGICQKITSEQLGLSSVLMSAANSSGGVMGR